MALVAGKKIVTNVQYIGRVADLAGGVANAPIIGFRRIGQPNQIFNFEPTEDNLVKICLRVNDEDVYVASVNPSPGDSLQGVDGGDFSLYTVHARPGQVVKLGIMCTSGMELFWTLGSDAEKTNITLQPENYSANQLWAPESV